MAYLFLFFGHLSFQLLFHSIFIFLNFQFYCSFLLVVLFQWLDIELVYPQVKKCFQNLQQKSVKWKTWKWKSLCGALGSFSPTPKNSLDKFPLLRKDIRIRVDRGLDLMRILADVIVVAHYHTGHPVKDVAVYSWFNKGCFGNRKLRIGKLLFGDHSSKSLHCSICSNDHYQSNLFWFSCIQISNFQLFGINNNGTSSNHNLRNWWVAKTLMSSCIICKVWGFQREFLRNYPVYWAQIFGDNWNCYAFSIIRVFTSLASAIR